jgi:hypothetical protein
MKKIISIILTTVMMMTSVSYVGHADNISYTVDNCSALNIRAEPSSKATILGVVYKNQTLQGDTPVNGWTPVIYNGSSAYAYSKYLISGMTTVPTVAPQITSGQAYSIPSNGGSFKSYTNYKLLSKKSPQWTKVQCNPNAYTDGNGLRKVGEYYCVAMGSYYSKTLGDLFEVQTEGGTLKVILCDFKADRHTDSTNRYTSRNGCVVEFYVNTSSLNRTAKRMGDISYIGGAFSGKVISITKIGNYFSN